MRLFLAHLVCLTLLLVTRTSSAQSLETLFAEANEAAFAGQHDLAIRKLERLIDAGVEDADVEFNLGTVHAQATHLGAAIQHFERALRIRPGDEGAERGLDDARRVLADRRARAEGEAEIDTGGGFGDALVRPFTDAMLAWALLVLELLLIAAIWVRAQAPAGSGRKLGATLIASIALLLTIGAATGVLLERGAFHDGEDAIVIRDTITLREGPDPRAAVRGEAREGDWIRILDTDDGFLLIRVAGHQGWVEDGTVGAI